MLVPGLANQFLPDQYKPKNVIGGVADYMYGAPVNMGTAKERGIAGIAGGFVDNLTGGMTDLDRRGDSKKQKDTKEFLKNFVYGSQGVAGRDMEEQLGYKQGSMNYEGNNGI